MGGSVPNAAVTDLRDASRKAALPELTDTGLRFGSRVFQRAEAVALLPLAFFGSNLYLNFFADRIQSPILILLAAGAIAVLLAWSTVAGHAVRIARSNPVLALRYE